MAEGYIKLHKSMLFWEWYDDPKTFKLFIHCLLKAEYQSGSWHGINYEAGQFITSLPNLSKETRLSMQEVRTALKHLISTGELTSNQHGAARIITINNWDKYQTTNRPSNRKATGKQQEANRELTSFKEYKEIKEIKNKYYDDDRLDEAFQNFMAMRVKIRKPMSDHAIELAKKKLEKLSGGDTEKAIAILDQSTLGSWQGLYELKEKEKTPAQKSGGNTRAYTSDFFAELEREAINGF